MFSGNREELIQYISPISCFASLMPLSSGALNCQRSAVDIYAFSYEAECSTEKLSTKQRVTLHKPNNFLSSITVVGVF